MDMFARDLAPIGSSAWAHIDSQAEATLRANLSARRFVDVKGPYGWDKGCVFEGHLADIGRAGEVGFGVHKCVRLAEMRVDFELSLMELHDIERGCVDPDLVPVEKAAISAAAFEDKAVFEGLKKAGFKGMAEVSANKAVGLPKADPQAFLRLLEGEVRRLETAESIEGPYALAGGAGLRDVLSAIVGDRMLLDIVTCGTGVDEFIYTPSYDGAFLVSKRGGDLELSLGGDFSIGYTERKGDILKFFLSESFAFRVIEPRAFTVVNISK